MKLLITNIRHLINVREVAKLLRGKELADLPIIENAYLQIEKGLIKGYGEISAISGRESSIADEVIDAKGASILPSWCDSHTHIVFAASREEEFVDKIKGASYAEIAAKGGGILKYQLLISMPEYEYRQVLVKGQTVNADGAVVFTIDDFGGHAFVKIGAN